MNLALWVTQGLLAAVFIATGGMKLLRSKEDLLAAGMAALAPLSPQVLRSVGALELLGAIGLILPWLTGIAPVLTPLAAIGLAIIMIGAIVAHVRLLEYQRTAGVVLLFLGCLFVAIGRLAGW